MKEVLSPRRLTATGLTCLCALIVLGSTSAIAAPAVTGTFTVPGIQGNGKDVAGPEGNMWVTLGGMPENVARITPGARRSARRAGTTS